MKKRVLSTLLALNMVLSLLSGTALAVDADVEGETPALLVEGTDEAGMAEKAQPDKPYEVSEAEIGAELYANSDWVSCRVNGGNLYFDPTTGAVADCDENVTGANIPGSINGVPVTSIGNNAFRDCSNLTSITIPASITSIGSYAFSHCSSLTSITIPANVTSIGNNAFFYCSALTSITIPGSVTSIGQDAFYYCSGLTSAGPIGGGYGYEFGWTKKIPSHAFAYCSGLTNITLPDSITSIGDYAFSYCSGLTSVTIPNGVTNIEDYTFFSCNALTSITLPDSVTSIGETAFYGCSKLTSITIPGSVTSIGLDAFRDCSSLTSITLPESVASIGLNAFAWCNNLTDIYYGGSKTQWQNITIYGGNDPLSQATIHYYYTSPDDANTFTEVHQLKSWDVFTNTVYFHDGTSYLRVSEDAVDLDSLLNCWVTCTLRNSDIGVLLVSMEKLEAKTETVIKTLNAYDVFTNIAYFTDNTSYLLGENVTIDLDSLLNIQVICTIESDPIKGIHLTAIKKYIDPTTITTARIIGQNTVKVQDDTTLTAKIHLTFGLTTPVEWTVDDASILGFVDANGAIVDHITTNLSDNTPRDFSIYQDIRGLKAGTATVTFSLTYGARHSLKIQVYEDGSKQLEHLTLEWVRAYKGYTDAVEKVLKDNKTAVPAPSIIQQAEALKEVDEKSKHKLLTFESKYANDDVIKDYAYRSVAEFLAETTTKQIDLGNVSTSDITKGANQIICAIYDSMDTQSYEYKYGGNITIIIQGLSASTSHNREIYYKKGSSRAILVAAFVSTQNEVVKVVQDYLKELKDLEKSYFKEAYNQIKKSIFSKSLNDLIKTGIDSALNPFFDEMKKIGLGKVNIALDTCLDYYGYVKEFLDIADSDPVSAANKLSSMETIYFESSDIKDDAVKAAMEALDAAKNALNSAVKQYRDTGKIDLKLTFSDFLSDTFDGIKTSFMCPVNVSIYSANGKQIGYVGEDNIWFDDSVIYVEKYGDTKTIYANDTSLAFVLVGTDDGMLNCMFEEYTNGEPLRRINYYDIELYDGKQITVNAPARNLSPDNLTVMDASSVLLPNESIPQYDYSDATVTITCTSNIAGSQVFGGGNYVRGDSVRLQAIAEEGYYFFGWMEENEALASVFNSYEFTAREDINLTAIFAPIPERDFPDVDSMYFIHFNPGDGYVPIDYIITTETGQVSNLPDATYEGYTFSGWYTTPVGGDRITVNTVFSSDTTVYAHWIYSGNDDNSSTNSNWIPSGNNSSPSVFSINSPSVSHGIVTISPKSAAKGNTVTITATPDAGYELATLTVADSKGNELSLTDTSNGKYTFTMSDSAVTVNARFESVEQIPEFAPESNPNWVNPYTDVSANAWYYAAVKFVSECSLMNGIGNDLFAPDTNLSRAQLTQILYNKEGKPVLGDSSIYTDVSNSAWYTSAIVWASGNGIVEGYGNNLFGPNDSITREQLAVMLWRYAGKPIADSELPFNDASQISSYALPAMRWAVGNGILNGEGNGILDPKGLATRAQVAQMFMNYLAK